MKQPKATLSSGTVFHTFVISSHNRIYKYLQNTVHTCANIFSTDNVDWQPSAELHSPPHMAPQLGISGPSHVALVLGL